MISDVYFDIPNRISGVVLFLPIFLINFLDNITKNKSLFDAD